MRSVRTILVFIALFLVVGASAALFFPKEQKKNPDAVLKIGAGDDVSGLLMKETVSELGGLYKVSEELESSSFQDCCSNSAQWALNAKEINVGFYCSHIAKHTIEQNQDVMIYGPSVMNAEIICYKGSLEAVRRVGVTQGRQQLKELSKKSYPYIEAFDEITQKGILYTLEDEQIDAAILDVTKAAGIQEYEYAPLSENDYISYVLVVEKTFAKTQAFRDFIKSYNRAVARLSDKSYLADKMETTEGSGVLGQVKFLSLDENEE